MDADHVRQDRLKVLIVDDNVLAAESLAIVITLWKYDTKVAFDGLGAIEAAESYKPHVVILDISLPGIDGYGVASQLRSRPHFQALMLIAMTGHSRDEDFHRSKSAGFDRHLVKPVNFGELQLLLESVGTKPIDG